MDTSITVLKATAAEVAQLEQFRNGNFAVQFILDAAGNHIIGESILQNRMYAAIHSELNALERIPYKPVVEEVASVFIYSTLSGVKNAVQRIKDETGMHYNIFTDGAQYAMAADETTDAHTSKTAQEIDLNNWQTYTA
ncbi:MAG: hypothetical protein HRU12_02790 [Phaeodactylibacter sp.]|nr:hypothetical protein [Phaeodactylibacter sp.]